MFMILPSLYIGPADDMGRGIFTSENIRARAIIEVSPVLVMKQKERGLVDETMLHNYIFEWGDSRRQCGLALGYVSLYNHSFNSNCEYEMEYEEQLIRIKAVRAIKKGEQLFINYNGTFNNKTALWFETR